MNAYELANNLDIRRSTAHLGAIWVDFHTLKEISDMLRQQANRIAELEKAIKEMAELYEQQFDKYARRVVELEKQTNLLTDEEIIKTYSEQYEKAGKLFNGGFKVNIPLMFARAIEAKIRGEK